MGKSLGVRVYSLHTLDADVVTRRAAMERVIALADEGRIAPPPPMRWPLAHASQAHAAMEARKTIGKVVLIPGGD